MYHYRKAFEVTGFIPQDSGYEVCPDCHPKVHPDLKGLIVECNCEPIFLTTETDTKRYCYHCDARIDTNVIGDGDA